MQCRAVTFLFFILPAIAGAASEPGLVDLYGDAIPAGASLRLGTVRFRHGGMPLGLQFLPDGKSLVCATEDGRVSIVATRTGKPLRQWTLGDRDLRHFHLSPDGNQLATLGSRFDEAQSQQYCTIRIWDVRSGRPQKVISWVDCPGSNTRMLRYTPDGAILITCSTDGTLRIWDPVAGEALLQYNMPERGVCSFAISPGSHQLAVACSRAVYLWEWMEGDKPVKLSTGVERPLRVDFSPDGRALLLGSQVGDDVCLWDLVHSKIFWRVGMDNTETRRYGARFSPSGTFIAASDCQSGTVLMYDAQTRRLIRTLRTNGDRVGGPVISSEERWLAAPSNGAIHLWSLDNGRDLAAERPGHEDSIHRLVFSQIDGQRVAITASDDGTVRVWDATTSRQLRIMRHEGPVRGMDVSPDGSHIVSSGLDDTVRLWDTTSGGEVYRLPGHGKFGGERAVAFAADGRQFVSWGNDWYLRVWDVRTGKALSETRVRPSGTKIKEADEDDPGAGDGNRDSSLFGLVRAELVGDARWLLIALGRTLYVFDVPSGKELRKLQTEEFRPAAMALAPDGKSLLTIGRGRTTRTGLKSGGIRFSSARNHTILLQELQTGRVLWRYDLPEGGTGAVAFSPDGKRMAAALRHPYDQIRIWDTETKQESARIEGIPGIAWLRSLAFSRDGRWLACGQRDTTVLIWDLQRLTRSPNMPAE